MSLERLWAGWRTEYVSSAGEAGPGDDDVANGTVGVNARGSDRPERGVAVGDFVDRLRDEATPPDFRRS